MIKFAPDQFNAEFEIEKLTNWLRRYILDSSSVGFPKVVVGVSGGKDSSVVAALCVHALGKDNVILVSLPDHESAKDQKDLKLLSDFLHIRIHTIWICNSLTEIYDGIESQFKEWANDTCRYNTPARIRMAYLYAIANTFHARVANTSNRSETYVGWDTKWGDQCGDFSLLNSYTASEVVAIGKGLGLPPELIKRVPDDGMRDGTDEDAWGFTYGDLDSYLLEYGAIPKEVEDKIEKMHDRAAHKNNSIKLPSPSSGTRIYDY